MSINDTTTYAELMEQINTPALAVSWGYEIKLKVAGEDVGVINMLSHNMIGRYHERYYGDNFLTIQVDPLAYQKIVVATNKLQVEIVKALMSVDGRVYSEVKRHVERFNAYLTEAPNPSVVAKHGKGKNLPKNVEQIQDFITITLHLVEPVVADMRYAETGGVFKDVTLEDVLKVVLGFELKPTPNRRLLEDIGYTGIRGVDVIPPDNAKLYKHIVIPNGSRLVNIPKFLQDVYGIYSSGLGWHIEKQRCFVYPLLRNIDYGKRHRMLTVLNVPPDEIPIMENTFIVRENQIYVFSTGDTQHINDMERVQSNLGNGVRFSRAGDLIDHMEKTTVNKSIWDVSKSVGTLLIDERPDEKNNIRFVKNRFTANPFKYVSNICSGLGTIAVFNWDYADPLLLYPGMQAKLLYKDDGKIVGLDGTLMGVETVAAPPVDSAVNRQVIFTCRLTLYLKRE